MDEKTKKRYLSQIEEINEINKLLEINLSVQENIRSDERIIFPIATKLFLNSEMQYRHDDEQGHLGTVSGAMING